jgi:hypothetical protein
MYIDFKLAMKIYDTSLDSAVSVSTTPTRGGVNAVSVVLFQREQADLPVEARVGDIIRMHRLKVVQTLLPHHPSKWCS